MRRSIVRQFDWNKARALWQTGKNTHEIAFELGVDESLIYNTIDWWKTEPVLLPKPESAA